MILYFYSFLHCFKEKDTWLMFIELSLVFFLTYIINRYVNKIYFIYLFMFIEFIVFSYIHVMLAPIILNILYFVFIINIGHFLLQFMKQSLEISQCFLAGISFVIIIECALSFVKAGSTPNFLTVILMAGLFSSLLIVHDNKKEICNFFVYDVYTHKKNSIAISVIATVTALLIGRCNLGIDYDGVWYGLRSEYLLNSGNGIYDRILAISIPNTYPKGYELLTLPLCVFPSYSFRIAFNIIIGLFILIMIHKVIINIKPGTSLMFTALIGSIPGVMSMCTTVKQDNITLLFQIIMIYYVLRFLKSYDSKELLVVFTAYILSLNMKTTALVFSSIILFPVLIFILIKKRYILWNTENILCFIGGILVTIFLCIRTYTLCGYPYTSLMAPLWNAMGLVVKEPYIVAEPTASAGLISILSLEGLIFAFKKIITAFFLPIEFKGIITSHILMTWGTPITAFSFFLIAISLKKKMGLLNDRKKFIIIIYGLTLICSLYSVASLYKNDGNYYMILYVLSVISVICITDFQIFKKHILYILMPVVFGNIFIFSLTGWAGGTRFHDITFLNKGYYNHKEVYAQQMKQTGKQKIYEYFTDHNISKVLAFGDIGIVDRLPCLVESAEEISAYGGYEKFSSYENFNKMLEETNTSEIYLDDSFNYKNQDILKYINNLIINNRIIDIIQENDNYIFVLNKGEIEFDLNIQKKQDFIDILTDIHVTHIY